ncbi:MAG: putative sucrose phosphorylase [Rariglobus sp.]|jgi:sucrose phosphorylase|nr:putative sucrose phosphorylase [Rariglobus sp.]
MNIVEKDKTEPVGETLPCTVRERLRRLYPADVADSLADELLALAARYRERIAPAREGWSERDVFLITYGDTIKVRDEAPLRTLLRFLRKNLGPAVTIVHLLPHFPFSSDDGFSVVDYRAVRGDLGAWTDLSEMAEDYRLVYDAVVNHASQHSAYIQGHCAGEDPYVDFAVAIPPGTDTSRVLRTRNLPLLHPFGTVRGVEHLWTTFSADQVDLNFKNPRVLVEMTDVLFFYVEKGASILRLDAIPYLWKELGTSCAHLPQTHEIIKLWRNLFDLVAPHVLLLTETNVPHRENVSYFGNKGDEAQIIYNFSLPPLLLWSLHKGDASILTQWSQGLDYIGPRATYLNLTATHDGIGMRPTEGLLPEAARRELCDLARDHGGDITGKRNADGSVSVYELNITYFDALNDPRGRLPLAVQIDRFVLSQAIPMALMGIPGFYLPSLLGSRNDDELVRQTKRARSINRPSLDAGVLASELSEAGSLRAQVLTRLKHLLALRSTLPAFHPDAAQQILDQGPALFVIRREAAGAAQVILAFHNVTAAAVSGVLPAGRWCDAIDGEVAVNATLVPPYAVRWFVKQS